MRILVGILRRKTVHSDFDHRQVGIAAESFALNTDIGSTGRTICGPDRDWLSGLAIGFVELGRVGRMSPGPIPFGHEAFAGRSAGRVFSCSVRRNARCRWQ